jgi:DNA-directed RNA polymerase subunit RPC12/RpoP
MIDTLLNLIFRCSHRRLTRPVTPAHRLGAPAGATYVVCLDCGKRFGYDTQQMQIGKPLGALDGPRSRLAIDSGKARRVGMAALWASLPLAVLLGAHAKKKIRESKATE